mmetsp:Transcript_28307/g.70067  ORF Transcript_28307/g.70067 Transcript_28307/m.70067 type:complete len:327 (-) Transcript_28307:96-1076(-)
MALGGTSVRQAYRRAGIKYEDVDHVGLGLDNETCAKSLLIRPKKSLVTRKPQQVGPRDLLRAMGYTEMGFVLPVQKWEPGEKSYDFPQWVKADGVDAPVCPYSIPWVCPTSNDVTPYVGCEHWEDMGQTIRFYLPYVYIKAAGAWFRLTGGTEDECGLMGVRHFALILRMRYEEGSMKADGEWRRHYPLTPFNQLEQLYFRGLELHAPAWTVYYKRGKGYNDIQHFDARKDEFSADMLKKKKMQEAREKIRADMAAKALQVERQNLLQELAQEAADDDVAMKAKFKEKEEAEAAKEMDKVERKKNAEAAMRKLQGEMLTKMAHDNL